MVFQKLTRMRLMPSEDGRLCPWRTGALGERTPSGHGGAVPQPAKLAGAGYRG